MERLLTESAGFLWRQSWQIAVVFAVVATACRALRRTSAHARYLLWLVVLAKCLAPPLLAVRVAILPAAGRQPVARPVKAGDEPAPGAAGGAAPSLPPQGALAAVPSGVEARAARAAAAAVPKTPGQWAALAWLAGATGFLALAAVKALRLQRRLRRVRRPAGAELRAEIAALAGRLGMRRHVSAWVIDAACQPFVWGLVRGDLYVPAPLAGAARREALLLHELAHVARRDALVNAVQVLVQAVFFFHPLVWWANRQIRREREKCCDEAAVAALGGRPKTYAAAVLEALARNRPGTPASPSLAVAARAKIIEERIRTIMRPNRAFHRRAMWPAAAAAAALAALAVPMAFVVTTRAADPTETSAETAGQDAEMVPCVRKYSVVLVVGADRMTFEGRDVTWQQLPERLEAIDRRDRTAFCVALADPEDRPERARRELMARAAKACRPFGFEGLSFIGRHPLGTKGEARFEPTVKPADLDARRRPAGPAARRLVGTWRGLAADKPGEGISLDLLTVELRIDRNGRLAGTATGRFVRRGKQELQRLWLRDGRLEFVVLHRTGVSVKALLRTAGDVLRGDCTPVNSREDACDILLERQPAERRGLVGLWYGLAVDKPGQGTSVDPFVLQVMTGEGGQLAGALYGRFSKSSSQRLQAVRETDGGVQFEVVHRTGIRMKVTLKREDGKLVGEAIPIDVDDDACDITLQRPVKGAKEPTGHQFFGPKNLGTGLRPARR